MAYKLRITLELDASIMCNFRDPDGVNWAKAQILAGPALFVGGDIGDVLDKDVTVSEMAFFDEQADGTWDKIDG